METPCHARSQEEICLCRDDAEDSTKYERVTPTGPTFMEDDECLRLYVDGLLSSRTASFRGSTQSQSIE
jgi:hypothetical protein